MKKNNKLFGLQLDNLPPDIQAYEIFPQIIYKKSINLLAVCKTKQSLNETKEALNKFASTRCISIIEEYLSLSNRHLVENVIKRDPRHFKLVDPETVKSYEQNPIEFAGSRPKKNLFPQKEKDSGSELDIVDDKKDNLLDILEDLEKKTKSIKSSKGKSWIIFIYDDRSRFDKFLLADLVIQREPIESRNEIPVEDCLGKFNQLEEFLAFQSYNCYLETFDLGIIQEISEKEKLFRQYWDLKNVEDYCSLPIQNKMIIFHTTNPENATINELLSFDIIFQIEKELEIRATFHYQHISVFEDQNKVFWIVELTRHPECYYYPLKDFDYRAFQVKNWRRVPNFFLGKMPDNIDRLYLANKNILRISFNKAFLEKSFVQSLQIKLEKLTRLTFIKSDQPTWPTCIKYYEYPLQLNTNRINQAQVPFELKFLIMIMISRGQIDVYNYPENFLEKIWEADKDKFIDNMRFKISVIEMIVNNKEFDKKLMSYSKFKEIIKKYIKVIKDREKILGSDRASEWNIGSFDAIFFNFELQITPSCIYYSCSDFEVSKSLYFEIQEKLKNFLLIHFIDETLEPIQYVRYMLLEFFYKNFFNEIKVFDREYLFCSFTTSQIESRSFWTYYPGKKAQIEKVPNTKSLFNQDGSFNFINLERNQFEYSYDTLDIKNFEIKVKAIEYKSEFDLSDPQNFSTRTLKFPFDGYVSGDILEDISERFHYGELPGIILRYSGHELLMLRNPNKKLKNIICFHQELLDKYKLNEVDVFDISDIPHYRSAFLNKRIITLLESFYNEYNSEIRYEPIDLEYALNVIFRNYYNGFLFNEKWPSLKKIVSYSKNAHFALYPLLTCSEYFPNEAYFFKLIQSTLTKSSLDIEKKLKMNAEFGAYLLGVFDSTETLKEGEVYYDVKNPFSTGQYKENAFPYVLVLRKPYLNHPHHIDIKIFKVNTDIKKEVFGELKNCLIFSSKDKNFVQRSSSTRDNYFLVFWDQNLLPERYKKLNEGKQFQNKKDLWKTSIEETSSDMNSDDWSLEEKAETIEKHKKIQKGLITKFQTMIRTPRRKDICNLHLLYADLSNSTQDQTALKFSEGYHDYYDLNKKPEPQTLLLNILENSKYKPRPFYLKEIPSLRTIDFKGSLISSFFSLLKNSFLTQKSYILNEPKFTIDKDLIYDGFEKHIPKGLRVLLLYKYDIQRLCLLYGCSQESDLYIGFNKREDLNWKEYESPRFSKKFINLKDYFRTLIQKYKRMFNFALHTIENTEQRKVETLRKASAWYVCSLYLIWKDDEQLGSLCEQKEIKPLLNALKDYDLQETLGLPWISASEHLTELKKKAKKKSVEKKI